MRQLSQPRESNAFAVLQGHKYISLTTFRRSGKPVSTPVRFVVESGKLYVSTRKKAGKVRRIHSNPKVQLAPCKLRGKVVGPTIEAVARILSVDEEVVAKNALERNYGWMMGVGNFFSNLRGDSGEEVYLEIVPVKEER